MLIHSTNALERFLEEPDDVPANAKKLLLDTDAELAFRSFYAHIWLVCRSAPGSVRNLGLLATRSYLTALRAAACDSSGFAWRDFIRAVWTLLNELDRYPSHASWRWREARGSLIRIVVENVDLLETHSTETGQR